MITLVSIIWETGVDAEAVGGDGECSTERLKNVHTKRRDPGRELGISSTRDRQPCTYSSEFGR